MHCVIQEKTRLRVYSHVAPRNVHLAVPECSHRVASMAGDSLSCFFKEVHFGRHVSAATSNPKIYAKGNQICSCPHSLLGLCPVHLYQSLHILYLQITDFVRTKFANFPTLPPLFCLDSLLGVNQYDKQGQGLLWRDIILLENNGKRI